MAEVVRWEIEPLERKRRGLDDRLRLRARALFLASARSAQRKPAGATSRKLALTRAVRTGWAATNRDDYELMSAAYHPDVEFYSPNFGQNALGFDPVYRGPDGVVAFVKLWKSGFERFRYEPREIADAGGDTFAVRLGMIAKMPGSDLEIREEYGTVITMRDGLVFRQVNYESWDEALSALEAGAGTPAEASVVP